MRLAIEDELAAGRLNVVLPEYTDVHHAGLRPARVRAATPLRARLFIDFLVEALGVSRDLSL